MQLTSVCLSMWLLPGFASPIAKAENYSENTVPALGLLCNYFVLMQKLLSLIKH